MALTVGNLLFNSTLDSFASVAFADEYHAKRGNVLWATLGVDIKEQLLIKASEYIQNAYFGKWTVGLDSVAGVPVNLARAVVELALIAQTAPLTPNIARGKKRVKVGPIEVEYDGNSPTATKFVSASLLLIPFLRTGALSSNFARLIRA